MPVKYSINKIHIGIDNGVSGSIGIIPDHTRNAKYFKMPIVKKRDYQKGRVKHINRIDIFMLANNLKNHIDDFAKCFFLLERPYTNPDHYDTTINAARAMEATLLTLEILGVADRNIDFIDSKEWQRFFFPSGIRCRENLKRWSLEVGKREFQHINFVDDADGLLIARYAQIKRM
jgi:hypothetical protein